jgi:peptidoglycan/LPS O-acetylase OafA/YrhL
MNRSRTLDILRMVAVLLVLGRHMAPAPEDTAAWLRWAVDVWHTGGWVGVDLFFVLSGFLVSGLLFKEHQRSGTLAVGRFLIRRGLKIYPPFYALLGLTVLSSVFDPSVLTPEGLVRELLFVQNYGPGLWNHTWSLAVEEHFYLLLPAVLALLLKWNRGRSTDPFSALPGLFLAIALLCLGLRLAIHVRAPYSHDTHFFPTHLRIDSLLFGVLLSYYQHSRPERFAALTRRHRAPLLVLGGACFLPAFVYPLGSAWQLTTFGVCLFYLGAGMVLCALHGWEPRPSPLARLLSFLGARSYCIYLCHMPMALWGLGALRALLPFWSWHVAAVAYVAGSFVLGVGVSGLLETPVLRLRDKYFTPRTDISPSLRPGS